MSNTSFAFKKFIIRQDMCAMKVTTDACILGSYLAAESPARILDIGTGTAVLAIMAAQKFPEARIHAVEVDADAYKQAEQNINECPWRDRIKTFHYRIQEFIRKDFSYDLIVCNPPYYEHQLKTENKKINVARHSDELNLKELAYAVNLALAEKGVFYLILPPLPFRSIVTELSFYGISLFNRLEILDKRGSLKSRYIGGFNRHEKQTREEVLFIRDLSGHYTDQFKAMLKDYYLAF